MPARRLRIAGYVQGVFFRAHTEERARELGITGWARNAENGSVEIHAEGTDEALEQLEAWCHRGPAAATVLSVHTEDVPEEGYTSFEIRY